MSLKSNSTLINRTKIEKEINNKEREIETLSKEITTLNLNALKTKDTTKLEDIEKNKSIITKKKVKINDELRELYTKLTNINNYRKGLRAATLPIIQENLTLNEKGKGKEYYNNSLDFRTGLTEYRNTTRTNIKKQSLNSGGKRKSKKARKTKKNYWFF